jgi:hypothetical protein
VRELHTTPRLLLALAVTLFAFWVRLPVLRQGLWEDEATAVYVAESPTIHEFFRRQIASDYSPPLFNALLAGYGRAVGFEEVPIKALAIGLGSLACGGIALAAGEGFGLAGALLAGLFGAINPLLIGMSGEIRPYCLSALLCALLVWAIFHWRGRWRVGRAGAFDFFTATAVGVLAVSSHYAATVAVGAMGGVALGASVFGGERAFWRRVSLAITAAGAAFAPWFPIALRQHRIGLPWSANLRPSLARNLAMGKALLLFPADPAAVGFWILLGLAVCAAAAIAGSKSMRSGLRESAIAVVLLGVSIGAAFFGVGLAGTVSRYVTVPVALASILLGGLLGITGRAAHRAGPVELAVAAAGVAILAVATAALGVSAHRKEVLVARRSKSGVRDFRRSGVLAPGDLVVASPDFLAPTIWYYAPPGIRLRGFVRWNEPALADFSNYPVLWGNAGIVGRTVASIESDLRAVPSRRIVLASAMGAVNNPLPFRDRDAELRSALRARYPRVAVRDFTGLVEGVHLEVFEAPETSR